MEQAVTDHLHAAIDEAAKQMLERCAKEVDGRPIPMSHQVEAFAAVAKWAVERAKLTPPPPEPPKKETEFDRIKRQFHGKRGPGRPPKHRPGDDAPGTDADEPESERGANHEPEEAAADTAGATSANGGATGNPAADEIYLDGGSGP